MLHTWVSTAGGPLIAVPKSELNTWAGVDLNNGPVETWGDYGRACAVEGYIGTVTVGAQQALVLVRATYTKDEDNWMILVQLQPAT